MASGQYQLQAAFTFPLTTEEYMVFLEHAKTCSDISVDLSKATFKDRGFSGCLRWLRLMQLASNGAITKIIFSFESLIQDQKNSARLEVLTKSFVQSDIFFNFVEIELLADKKFLKTLSKEYRVIYDTLQIMCDNKKKKILNYSEFVTESKQLFQEFRAQAR